MSTLEAVGTRELTLGQAVSEALREELRRDPTTFVIGEEDGRIAKIYPKVKAQGHAEQVPASL